MNICERCNGCGWENPAQAINKCSACGGSGKDGRERMTLAHLLHQTGRMRFDAEKNREDVNKLETSITIDEFHDLKRDMDFVNSFHWADVQDGIPLEFKCNNITVKVIR